MVGQIHNERLIPVILRIPGRGVSVTQVRAGAKPELIFKLPWLDARFNSAAILRNNTSSETIRQSHERYEPVGPQASRVETDQGIGGNDQASHRVEFESQSNVVNVDGARVYTNGWRVAQYGWKSRNIGRAGGHRCGNSRRIKVMLPDKISDHSQPLCRADVNARRVLNTVGQAQARERAAASAKTAGIQVESGETI